MNPNANGNQENDSKKKEQQLDVERAVAEGMDTPPARSDGASDLGVRAMRLRDQLASMLKERSAQVLGVIAGVSFVAGVLVGRIGRRR